MRVGEWHTSSTTLLEALATKIWSRESRLDL